MRALRRPTRAAWAINAAVRAEPDAALELADEAGQLGDAQRKLLAGGGPERLRDAQTRVDAVVAVLPTAVPIEDAPTLEKVRQTLRAAVIDADALTDVLDRLLPERVVSGFGDLSGALPQVAHEPAPRTHAGASGESAAKVAERAARETEQQARRRPPNRPLQSAASGSSRRAAEAPTRPSSRRGPRWRRPRLSSPAAAPSATPPRRLADAARKREQAEQSYLAEPLKTAARDGFAAPAPVPSALREVQRPNAHATVSGRSARQNGSPWDPARSFMTMSAPTSRRASPTGSRGAASALRTCASARSQQG